MAVANGNIFSSFFENNRKYALTILNTLTGNYVSSTTQTIGNFKFRDLNLNYPFGFYNPNLPDSSKFKSKLIKWDKAKNGEIYQLSVRFNYLENGELLHLLWDQAVVSYDNIPTMSTTLEGAQFFNFLSNNIFLSVTFFLYLLIKVL